MNILDLVVLVVLVGAGVVGRISGLVGHFPVWIGTAVGALGALGAIDPVVHVLDASPAEAVPLATSLMVFGTLAGGALGLVASAAVHVAVPDELHTADRVAGASTGVIAMIALLWLLLPVLASSDATTRTQVTGSFTHRAIDAALPTAPDVVEILGTLAGGALPPSIVGIDANAPVGPPPATLPVDAAGQRQIEDITVRLRGTACGSGQVGSGIVVADGVIVTNAHVVAGVEPRTQRVEHAGDSWPATLVHWDPRADVAVLLAPGVRGDGIVIADAAEGAHVAVAGHPGGGGLEIVPGRIASIVNAHGRDIYDGRDVSRKVLVLASTVEGGNSGGPVVRADGALIGMVFAHSSVDEGVGYALDAEAIRTALASRRSSAVLVGPCLQL